MKQHLRPILFLKTFFILSLIILLPRKVFAISVPPTLKYFGYYNYDYPGSTPQRNFDEIKGLKNTNIGFTNLWEENTPGIEAFRNSGMLAIVKVDDIFFELGPTGKPNQLIPDWQAKLLALKIKLEPYQNLIYGYYLSDEPFFNDISREDFRLTSKAIRDTFPNKAIMAVEAYPPIQSNIIPSDYYEFVTDLGFDYYFTMIDPNNDIGWNNYLSLNQKFSPHLANKKVWVIPDGYALDQLASNRLPNALERYYNFALSSNNIVGVLVYSYGSGYQFESRNFLNPNSPKYNATIRARHIEIGQSIIANYKYLPGDFDKSGKVDESDYNLLKTNFGRPYTLLDYNLIATNFGK